MEPAPQTLKCPKCPGTMRSYERSGVNIEQCDTCRGIFLDFGELETVTRLEAQWSQPAQQAPPAAPYPPQPQPQYQQQPPYPPQPQYQQGPHYQQGPGWGGHYGHKQHRGGFSRLFYSS